MTSFFLRQVNKHIKRAHLRVEQSWRVGVHTFNPSNGRQTCESEVNLVDSKFQHSQGYTREILSQGKREEGPGRGEREKEREEEGRERRERGKRKRSQYGHIGKKNRDPGTQPSSPPQVYLPGTEVSLRYAHLSSPGPGSALVYNDSSLFCASASSCKML